MAKKKQVISPIEGGVVDKISPLLKYEQPFLGPDSFNELMLILENKTDQRIEGLLEITPPPGWTIEPGNQLIMEVRAEKFVTAEFYLAVPEAPTEDEHLLEIQVLVDNNMIAKASFDLGSGLLFVVED